MLKERLEIAKKPAKEVHEVENVIDPLLHIIDARRRRLRNFRPSRVTGLLRTFGVR